MNYRQSLIYESGEGSSPTTLWEESSSQPFPRFEQGDVIVGVEGLPHHPENGFTISRVEYRFSGESVRETVQILYLTPRLAGTLQ